MPNIITSIASAIIEGPEGMDASHMSMCGVNSFDSTAASPLLPERTFQYWPDTISDTVEAGWDFKQIPGTSHPIAQWTQNGSRTISFEVTLARFMKPVDKRSALEKLLDPFELTTPLSEGPKNLRPWNANIKGMVKYLRSFWYPLYAEIESGYETAYPPAIAILNIPGVGLNEDGSDSIYAVMTGCDVNYELLFPNGEPRLATVSLTFVQVVQKPGTQIFNFKGFDPDFSFDAEFGPYEDDALLGGGYSGDIGSSDPS